MKNGNKLYWVLNKIIHIILPVLILIYAVYCNITYNSSEDIGGWGGLAIAGLIIVTIVWLVVVMVISTLFKKFSSQKTTEIVKIILAIINFVIYLCFITWFLGEVFIEIIIGIFIVTLVLYIILIVKNNK